MAEIDDIERISAAGLIPNDPDLDRLREAASGDADAAADEKKVLQARRAVEKAIRALGGEPEDF